MTGRRVRFRRCLTRGDRAVAEQNPLQGLDAVGQWEGVAGIGPPGRCFDQWTALVEKTMTSMSRVSLTSWIRFDTKVTQAMISKVPTAAAMISTARMTATGIQWSGCYDNAMMESF